MAVSRVFGQEPSNFGPSSMESTRAVSRGPDSDRMAKTSPPTPVSTNAPDQLDELGLQAGDAVRFSPTTRGQARLQNGTLRGSNKDGSLTITDGKGASRAIPPDRVWRSTKTKRGRLTWVPVLASDEVQLQLFRL